MNKILSAAALATVAVMVSGAANAQAYGDYLPWNWVRGNEVYTSVKGGVGQLQDTNIGGSNSLSNKAGYGANAAVGKYLNPNLRTEIELGYYNSENDFVDRGVQNSGAGGDNTAYTAMLNAYYEPFADCRLKPYIGGGVGYIHFENDVQFGGRKLEQNDDKFGYQGMAGVSYQVNPNLAATAEYRYVGATGVNLGASSDADYNNHLGMAGLRYKF